MKGFLTFLVLLIAFGGSSSEAYDPSGYLGSIGVSKRESGGSGRSYDPSGFLNSIGRRKSSGGRGSSFHFEGALSTGVGSTYTDIQAQKPSNHYYEAGLTIGYFLTSFFYLGTTASYQRIQQETISQTYGNREGYRFEAYAPTVGIRLWRLYFKYKYSLRGNYEMEEKTSGDEDLSYTDLKGKKLSLFYVSRGNPIFGVYMEDVVYQEEIIGSSEYQLTEPLRIKSYGLTIAWVI